MDGSEAAVRGLVPRSRGQAARRRVYHPIYTRQRVNEPDDSARSPGGLDCSPLPAPCRAARESTRLEHAVVDILPDVRFKSCGWCGTSLIQRH